MLIRNFIVCALSIGCAAAGPVDLRCATCHVREAKEQATSRMQHALVLPESDAVFKSHPILAGDRDGFHYRIQLKGVDAEYTVSDGTRSITVPVHWIFGADNQTFVFEYQGRWYEGLVSYFSRLQGLDTTIGDTQIHPAKLEQALGRPIDDEEKRDCFGCHTSDSLANNSLNLANLSPGVTCDHCHEGALQHQAAALKGSTSFMPPKLTTESTEQISSFCGQCHRTWPR